MTTISKKHKAFLDKECSILDHVTACLKRIDEQSDLNAFTRIYKDEALEKASQLDKKIKNGDTVGEFAGIVVGIKDNFNYTNHEATCGSNILKGYTATYSAHVVDELIKKDAIIIGHLNMDEFAMGSSNETSVFGNVLNPVDKTRVPGGSSGGSAAAVKANLVDVSLGSDTGGSIRQPAAFTGTVGFKPTYGLISRYGITAFGSSLDQVGPFANSVEDTATILNTLVSHDKNDSTSVSHNDIDFTSVLDKDISGLKIGVPEDLLGEGLNEEIKLRLEELKLFLAEKGASIVPVKLPNIKYSIAVYYIIATAEASANLQRFDGVRYGLREKPELNNLDEMYKETRSSGFGEEVKRRIALGTFVLSHGYFDAYYRKSQKVRRLIKNDYDKAFSECDVVLMPSTPTTAFKFGEFSDDPIAMYLADIYTASANLAGIPGISVPVGNDSKNLPIGMQFLANQFEDAKVIQVADFVEKNFKK